MWNEYIKLFFVAIFTIAMIQNFYTAGKIRAGEKDERTFEGTLGAAIIGLILIVVLLI